MTSPGGRRASLTPSDEPSLSRHRILWRIALAVVVVCAALAGLVWHLHGSATTPLKVRSLPDINPLVDNIGAKDVTWSPQGTRIAFLGPDSSVYSPDDAKHVPGLLGIYDATSHRLLTRIQPDATVLAVPELQVTPAVEQAVTAGGLDATPQIDYTHVLWSPDGTSLALTFDANVPNGAPQPSAGGDGRMYAPGRSVWGVYLSDASGAHARVLIRPSGLADTRYTEWDTHTVSVTSLTLPPAITYRWSSGGALIVPNQDAQSPTPDASPTGTTLAPVGVLNRNAEFTVWQPGDLTYMVQNSQGQLEPPGAYSWTTSRLAWSPDGRYLLSLDDKTARIQPAGQTPPTQQALADFGLANAPVLPVRDAGLQAILAAMPANTADRFTQSLRLAWRPDGKVVAVQPRFYRDDRAVSQHAVTLYDCETGRKLATLLPHITMVHGAYGGNDGYLRWSADGSHLLLLDSALGPTTIWGPDQLPR